MNSPGRPQEPLYNLLRRSRTFFNEPSPSHEKFHWDVFFNGILYILFCCLFFLRPSPNVELSRKADKHVGISLRKNKLINHYISDLRSFLTALKTWKGLTGWPSKWKLTANLPCVRMSNQNQDSYSGYRYEIFGKIRECTTN